MEDGIAPGVDVVLDGDALEDPFHTLGIDLHPGEDHLAVRVLSKHT